MIALSLIIPSIIFIISGVWLLGKNSKVHNYSAAVLLTAGVVYSFMSFLYVGDSNTNLRPLRYLDWVITVPIMVYQMSRLANNSINVFYIMLTSLLMLATGYLGEIGIMNKIFAAFIGTVFAVFTFLPLLGNIDYRINRIFYLTMVGWVFYPLVYLINDTTAIIYMFSIVDLSVKLGLSLYLYRKIA